MAHSGGQSRAAILSATTSLRQSSDPDLVADEHGRPSVATTYCVDLEEVKATTLIEWLESEYGLGRGRSMPVWAAWKDEGWVAAPKGKAKQK